MYKNNRYTPPRSPKKTVFTVLAVIVVLIGIVAVLEATNTTYFFHDKKPSYNSPTAGPATKGIPDSEQGQDNKTNDSSNDSSNSDDDAKHPTAPVDTNANLTEPTGNFISTHTIALGTNPQMESICNTTAGASCKITFTNGSTTKSLSAQNTDRGGATYWAWKPKDSNINLTPGTWTVTAVAQLGSQTKTTVDATKLEVTQ